MERDVEKVREIYEAYGRQDLNAALSLMSENVELTQSRELPWGGQYHGHEGARQFMGSLTAHVQSRIIPERFIDAGSQIAVIGRTVGKTRKTGLEFDVPIVHVWSFAEGQATRFEAY